MTIDFTGKVVVVTGAASGIGKATARMFAESNARLVLLDINPDGALVAAELGAGAVFINCDVALAASVEAAFAAVRQQFERVDVLVNNAGIQTYGKVADTSEAVWDRTMAVNVKGLFLCAKYAIPLMQDAAAPAIVNVSSVKSFVCQDNEAAYATSKAAVLGLTRSIAADYAPHIRCVTVCPGAVATPLLLNDLEQSPRKEQLRKETEQIHLLNRIADPDEVASFILFLASERAGFATGQAFRVDGGIGVRIAGI